MMMIDDEDDDDGIYQVQSNLGKIILKEEMQKSAAPLRRKTRSLPDRNQNQDQNQNSSKTRRDFIEIELLQQQYSTHTPTHTNRYTGSLCFQVPVPAGPFTSQHPPGAACPGWGTYFLSGIDFCPTLRHWWVFIWFQLHSAEFSSSEKSPEGEDGPEPELLHKHLKLRPEPLEPLHLFNSVVLMSNSSAPTITSVWSQQSWEQLED